MSSHKFLNHSHQVDELTGTDYTNDRVEAWKSFTATLSARPKKDVSTTFTVTQQHEYNKEGAKVESQKSEAKVSVNRDIANTHWTFANDKFAAKAVKYDITNEHESKWHINAELSGEFKPAKDEWKVTTSASGHTPDFSGVRAHFQATAEINQKKDITLKKGFNFAHEEKHHLGGYLEHDTKEFKRLWAQVAFTPEHHQLGFIRADVLKHLVSAGGMHKFNDDATHGFEVVYDAADGAKGFQGFPVTFRSGAHYRLSDATHLKTAVLVGEHYGGHLKVEHKIDSHWTVESHQEFCSGKLKVAGGPYDLGFKVHYKL